MPTRFIAEPIAAGFIAELGESPLWEPDVGIRWLDIDGQRLFTVDLAGQQHERALHTRVTAIELMTERNLLAVTNDGFAVLDPEVGRLQPLAKVDRPDGVAMNDAAIDPQGRCWVGSAVRDGSRRGELYRFDGTSVTTQVKNIGMSNGIDWSPDGATMYHVDTAAGTITAYDYDGASGELGHSRLLRTVPKDVGLPDGMAVDRDGNLWVALWGAGQVCCLDQHHGHTIGIVEVPASCTTSCVFGGPDMSTMYITTAQPPAGGMLHAIELPVQGQPPRRFSAST